MSINDISPREWDRAFHNYYAQQPNTPISFTSDYSGPDLVKRGNSIDTTSSQERYNDDAAYQKLNKSNDMVNEPPHYRQGDIECIDALKACLTEEEFRGHMKATVISYLWRERYKGSDEDVSKARWYLDRLIKEAVS